MFCFFCDLCVGCGWGVLGRDNNEERERFREEIEESKICFYFVYIFIYSYIMRERY